MLSLLTGNFVLILLIEFVMIQSLENIRMSEREID